MTAYYNEIEPYAAQCLRNLIVAGLIPAGHVDERSIVDVRGSDLAGFRQIHLYAGIGGWPTALRLVGWPDDRPVLTFSEPCQPYSEAGRRLGFADKRALRDQTHRIVRECHPPICFGEQVPEAIRLGWLDRVSNDLEGAGYAIGSAVLTGCLVEARQERERLWFVASADSEQVERPTVTRLERHSWPAEPDVARVAHGVPEQRRVVRAFGNAIIPAAAADFIGEAMSACQLSSQLLGTEK
jgi:DNA (cytosine-5)-methyltransferase 1